MLRDMIKIIIFTGRIRIINNIHAVEYKKVMICGLSLKKFEIEFNFKFRNLNK